MALRRSIGFRLTIGIVLIGLAVALAVGWQFVVVSDLAPVARGLTRVHWLLLILGTLFFALIITGLVLLCAWLVREMRHSQRQEAFVDAVTHEMKTPLASMRLYTDTLNRHDLSPEKRREFLGRIEKDLDRLDRTVTQVLAAGRSAEPERKATRDRIALVDLLSDCIAEICSQHELPPDAVRLEVEQGPTVSGDSAELGFVFHNLLENAVKYSNRPVRVRVGVESVGTRRVQVEIADQGIGIPPRELRKIFQRFYRVGLDVQRKAVGLGLGLFIVRNLVRRQGGKVSASSEGLGRGSRFVVTLRAIPPAA